MLSKMIKKQSGLSHQQGGRFIKDVVYGANDGIITTFAVIAGVAGASLPPITVLLLGFANLLADGFSMAASNYLGTKSESDVFKREHKVESSEVEMYPREELDETRNILIKKGYKEKDLEELLNLISKNKNFWVDLMLHEELKLSPASEKAKPVTKGIFTFVAFVVAGSAPLLPFIFLQSFGSPFKLAAIFTALTLFLVGSMRSIFTEKRWFFEGMEMFLVGGMASVIAYTIGYFVKIIIT
jgi:VIT1/CCC1 family predicted Fe2+/Mn2+ transporter